jgi:carbamoyltransferase
MKVESVSQPVTERRPLVLGWHDSHCASAAVVADDGHVLYAAAEERFTKKKLYKGYPATALRDATERFEKHDLDVCYCDMSLPSKVRRNAALLWNTRRQRLNTAKSFGTLVRTATERMGGGKLATLDDNDAVRKVHRRRREPPLRHDSLCEHHAAHAAGAYYPSGFNDAVVITIDGVGDCLSATIYSAHDGQLRRTRQLFYNEFPAAADYEVFTAMMGFNPDRHCGKITGLAGYGARNDDCVDAVRQFFGDSWQRGRSNFFDAMHGPDARNVIRDLRRLRETRFGRFRRENLAFAIQHLTEERVLGLVQAYVSDVPRTDIALAGGLFANVRINQKIKELGFRNIFIQPAMDDGGLSFGAALHHLSCRTRLIPRRLPDVFLGPGYTVDHIQDALDRAGLDYDRLEHLPYAVARLIADGKVVARYDGRMEFGPRALGNRSILYDTRDPSVNTWLNKRLRRTEFMPFAPATLDDHADSLYQGLEGCRHTAEFMTITFDCTDEMKRLSPAVVHVDGTARAQLVRAEANPGLYEIIDEYRRITGIPSVVNTSFNMHESPIVATPEDAIQSFRQGRLDYLAIGPFLVRSEAERAVCDKERPQRMAESVAG